MRVLLLVLLLVGSILAESWMCKAREAIGIESNGEPEKYILTDFVLTETDSTITIKRFGKDLSVFYENCRKNVHHETSVKTCQTQAGFSYQGTLLFNKKLKRVTIFQSGSFVHQEDKGAPDAINQATCVKT